MGVGGGGGSDARAGVEDGGECGGDDEVKSEYGYHGRYSHAWRPSAIPRRVKRALATMTPPLGQLPPPSLTSQRFVIERDPPPPPPGAGRGGGCGVKCSLGSAKGKAWCCWGGMDASPPTPAPTTPPAVVSPPHDPTLPRPTIVIRLPAPAPLPPIRQSVRRPVYYSNAPPPPPPPPHPAMVNRTTTTSSSRSGGGWFGKGKSKKAPLPPPSPAAPYVSAPESPPLTTTSLIPPLTILPPRRGGPPPSLPSSFMPPPISLDADTTPITPPPVAAASSSISTTTA